MMYFLIKDDDLFNKYNTIWNKLSDNIKTMYNNEHVYNRNFLKTKTKYDGDETTDFDDKGVPKVDSNYTCLSEISLDSIVKTNENYFLQVFLKEWKYIFKKSDCTYY